MKSEAGAMKSMESSWSWAESENLEDVMYVECGEGRVACKVNIY